MSWFMISLLKYFYFWQATWDVTRSKQINQDQGQLLHHHRQHLLIEVKNLWSSLETCLHLTILCWVNTAICFRAVPLEKLSERIGILIIPEHLSLELSLHLFVQFRYASAEIRRFNLPLMRNNRSNHLKPLSSLRNSSLFILWFIYENNILWSLFFFPLTHVLK